MSIVSSKPTLKNSDKNLASLSVASQLGMTKLISWKPLSFSKPDQSDPPFMNGTIEHIYGPTTLADQVISGSLGIQNKKPSSNVHGKTKHHFSLKRHLTRKRSTRE